MKNTRKSLLHSVIALLLCFSMLLSTTFAWFTDSVESGTNQIVAGNLDIELEYSHDGKVWNPVQNSSEIFDKNAKWEPGYTEVVYLRISNLGSLALKYQLGINIVDERAGTNVAGETFKLSDYIYMGVAKDQKTTFTSRDQAMKAIENPGIISTGYTQPGTMTAGQDAQYLAVVVYMPETVGNDANYKTGTTPPQISLGITLVATQMSNESDSFGSDYDAGAEFPVIQAGSISTNVTLVDGKVSQDATVENEDQTLQMNVTAGVEATSDVLTLSVSELEGTQSNVVLGNNEVMRSLDVHMTGVSANNTQPMTITIKEAVAKGLNSTSIKLYHVENGQTIEMTAVDTFTAHNQFKYDPATGNITLYMATFSEVALVADTVNAWEGKFDYTWYDASKTELTIANADQLAAFGAIVGGMAEGIEQDSFSGKTVKLVADINLGDKESENNPNLIFYPIGYWNNEGTYERKPLEERTTAVESGLYSFCGTFDGNGHTIANFYHNTWEMKGDHNWYDPIKEQYYRDGMGLFGKVYGATIKNLTVKNFSSDGEIATTGVIAAYADGATFENIAIINCNPRVYNIGNGGIVGCVGWYAKEANLKTTFKNITVDNSNKISALWGSYDVACGGIVGQYYPTSGQTSAGTPANGGISFENCHVQGQIDVYNDVCGNYQYYAYRYAGMMIGSIRENQTIDGRVYPKMDGITAKNCTVHYDTWNDYFYCELVANSQASYTHDHQMSRLVRVASVDGTTITPLDGESFTVPQSGRYNYVVTHEGEFATDNATCYHFVDGKVWQHEDAGTEIVNGETVLKEDKQHIYLPFGQLFTGYGWGVTSKGLSDYNGITTMDITGVDQKDSVEKFETKFTGDFLYRVGNQNTVSIGSLFKYKDGVDQNGSGVWVTVEKVHEDSNVSGTFKPNTTDWTKGTIQFSGTGVVKLTIQDYNFCTPTELIVEIVDAKNATSAASATSNNVVLLNNVTNGSFIVSNGYTFYGNGFTVTLPTNSVQEKGQGFTGYVSIGAAQDSGTASGGNLDNVRIVGPEYPEMYLYRSQAEITDKNDPDYGSGSNMRYFRNSVIVYGGNVNISNCYISGCRTAVCLRGGNNVVIENTTISGGSVANMQIAGVNSLVLRDVTTDGNLGIYVDSSVADISVEGQLNQYNWTTQAEWTAAIGGDTNAKFFPDFFSTSNETYKKYQHTYNDTTYVNMAFIFACDWEDANLDYSKQSNSGIYETTTGVKVTTPNGTVTGGVYSVANQNLTGAMFAAPEYISAGYNPIAPTLNFDNTTNHDDDDANDANDTYCVYNESTGTLKIGVSGASKTIDLSGVQVSKNGVVLEHTAYINGTKISGNSVSINSADGAKQTLTFKAKSNDAGFDKDGNPIAGEIEYTWTVTVEIAVLSYPAPEWNMGGVYQFDKTNLYYAYYKTSQGYGEAVPIYKGIKIKYYDKTGKLVTLDLSGTTTHPTGSANSNANAFTYTLSDGSTLTMKFSSGWKSGATTHQFTTYSNMVYIYPQSLDNDNYVRAKTTNQDFDVKITYTFTDPNGQSISQTMRWYNEKSTNSKVSTIQWKDFDSTNGKSSSSTCIAEGSMITMADGSKKAVEDVRRGDLVMAFDHVTGKVVYKEVALVGKTYAENYYKSVFVFDDGTELMAINEHGIFDLDLNQYVNIGHDNYQDYIGHRFVSVDSNGNVGVKYLVNVISTVESGYKYDVVTNETLTYVVEDTLSVSHEIVMIMNSFAFGEDMTYDAESMQTDIEKYGLYTYEDFAEYCDRATFEKYNMAMMKVGVGKGIYTYEHIVYLLTEIALNDSVQII